ncbi:MAG: hypothetical protein DHS80DRAFT_21090 [Piptocephalis tieghemiana]|nr:MAG: hypothetical protein DHS80DRAFT_21090 [Piptocephalis tieghemiana]
MHSFPFLNFLLLVLLSCPLALAQGNHHPSSTQSAGKSPPFHSSLSTLTLPLILSPSLSSAIPPKLKWSFHQVDSLIRNLPQSLAACWSPTTSSSSCRSLRDLYPSLPYLPALWLAYSHYEAKGKLIRRIRTYRGIAYSLSSLLSCDRIILDPDRPLPKRHSLRLFNNLGYKQNKDLFMLSSSEIRLDFFMQIADRVKEDYLSLSSSFISTELGHLYTDKRISPDSRSFPLMYDHFKSISNLIYATIYFHFIRTSTQFRTRSSKHPHTLRYALPPCPWIQDNLILISHLLRKNAERLALQLHFLHDPNHPSLPHPLITGTLDLSLHLLSSELHPFPSIERAQNIRLSYAISTLSPRDFTYHIFRSNAWDNIFKLKLDLDHIIKPLLRLTDSLAPWIQQELNVAASSGKISPVKAESLFSLCNPTHKEHPRRISTISSTSPSSSFSSPITIDNLLPTQFTADDLYLLSLPGCEDEYIDLSSFLTDPMDISPDFM